jgi:nucleotide-binding universal stress UspA family protein
MSSQKILVPYNFTAYDQKALDFIIRTFAHLEDVEITLFHTYIPAPEIDVRSTPMMEKLKGDISFLSKKIKEQEKGLKTAKQKLLQNGFSESRVHYIFQPRKKDVAAEVIALAKNQNFNLIVLNSKPGKLSHFFTGNLFSKVINALKDTTVCVVS